MSKSKRRARKLEKQARKDAKRNEKARRKEANRTARQGRKMERMNLRLTKRNERVSVKQQSNIAQELARSEADKVAYQNGVDPVERGKSGGGFGSGDSDGGGGGIWGGIKGAFNGIFGNKNQEVQYDPGVPQPENNNTIMGMNPMTLVIGIGAAIAIFAMFNQGKKRSKSNGYYS